MDDGPQTAFRKLDKDVVAVLTASTNDEALLIQGMTGC
jgi:hypothetical protein